MHGASKIKTKIINKL